jgi:hypothetical protein
MGDCLKLSDHLKVFDSGWNVGTVGHAMQANVAFSGAPLLARPLQRMVRRHLQD